MSTLLREMDNIIYKLVMIIFQFLNQQELRSGVLV
jgi:hypothetical protein